MPDKNIKVNFGNQPDPELQREKLESDRRRLIESRAAAIRLIPSDWEGMFLIPLTPLTIGFSTASIIAALNFPLILVSAVGILGSCGAMAIAFAVKDSKPAKIGVYLLAIFFTVGAVGGLRDGNENLESSAIQQSENRFFNK